MNKPEREADREKMWKGFAEYANTSESPSEWEVWQAACASKQKEIDALQARVKELSIEIGKEYLITAWNEGTNLTVQEVPQAEQYKIIGYIQHGALPIDPRGADSVYIVEEEGFDGCTVPVFIKGE